MRNKTIKIFYNPKQVLDNDAARNYSKSPLKPKIVVEKLRSLDPEGLLFKEIKDFRPFSREDFLVAHYPQYVNDFFNGTGSAESNSLSWSPQFAESVRYTNSSLYHAIRNSILSGGRDVSFSPTSGFHHASPPHGSGFCTFSGQVIASVKLWREYGLVGTYLDLDGHFGNSIEDSRDFVTELKHAIPEGNNVNPQFSGQAYVDDLKRRLNGLELKLLTNQVHYIVWCHGADSHMDDDLGRQVSTEQWFECSEIFYRWLSKMDRKLGRPVPLAMALFGGYRKDHYDSVINLHVGDIARCSNLLLDNDFEYNGEIRKKIKVETPPIKRDGSWYDL